MVSVAEQGGARVDARFCVGAGGVRPRAHFLLDVGAYERGVGVCGRLALKKQTTSVTSQGATAWDGCERGERRALGFSDSNE